MRRTPGRTPGFEIKRRRVVMAFGLRENDSDWRDWALQRMWSDGRFRALYEKRYKTEPPFGLGDAGRLQPGHDKVAKEHDFW